MGGRALVIFALAAAAASSAPSPPVLAPAPDGSPRLPDSLTITKAKLDPEATRTIGTCDPRDAGEG